MYNPSLRVPVLLTLPAVTSTVVTALALFVGVAAIAISTGPGLRELRWFGIAALCASVYGTCTFPTTLEVAPETRAFFGRLGGASASLLVGSWLLYFSATRRGATDRWERVVAVGIAVVAIAWMIPGVCRTSEILVRPVPWLGVTYASTRPTVLGRITYFFLVVVTTAMDVRLFKAWRRGGRGALADFLGVTVQLVTGINDALAASGKIDSPYMLDVGQFAVVVAAGSTLVRRFVSDARALERSSADLRAAQKELVRRERLAALGELSAVVAHEVRNPLSVIFNAVTTLRKLAVSPEAETLLDIVDEEAERLKRVVGELLEFARPRELSVVEAVAPPQLVSGAVEAAVAAAGEPGAVEMEVERDLPALPGDEQLLRQALINLITNALQATGRTSRVAVVARAEGRPTSSVCFDVSDDGAGVPKEVADKMFTPFFTTRASGTGLGLAIVKRIAEAHGGEVTWRPRDPGGVTFTLRVPTSRPGSPPPGP